MQYTEILLSFEIKKKNHWKKIDIFAQKIVGTH